MNKVETLFVPVKRDRLKELEAAEKDNERLTREAKNDAIAYRAAIERQNELRAELAALRAQQPGVVLPERLRNVLAFLDGTGELEGRAFGEVREKFGKFWWRKELREAVAELNASPVSAQLAAPAGVPDGFDVRGERAIALLQEIQNHHAGKLGFMHIAIHKLLSETPAAESTAKQSPASSDREALFYLMNRFDNEMSICSSCGNEETTRDMDSAIYLREYLAGELPEKKAARLNPASAADVVPVPRDVFTSIANADPTYHHIDDYWRVDETRCAYCLRGSQSRDPKDLQHEADCPVSTMRALLNGGRS